MHSIIYRRICELCAESGITVKHLEKVLKLGDSTIRRWGDSRSPTIAKIQQVADYFHVSADYILGRSDIRVPAERVLHNDPVMISIQRAKQTMPPEDIERMMKMLSVTFDYAFKDDEKDDQV